MNWQPRPYGSSRVRSKHGLVRPNIVGCDRCRRVAYQRNAPVVLHEDLMPHPRNIKPPSREP
jgi:hypothetical protein